MNGKKECIEKMGWILGVEKKRREQSFFRF